MQSFPLLLSVILSTVIFATSGRQLTIRSSERGGRSIAQAQGQSQSRFTTSFVLPPSCLLPPANTEGTHFIKTDLGFSREDFFSQNRILSNSTIPTPIFVRNSCRPLLDQWTQASAREFFLDTTASPPVSFVPSSQREYCVPVEDRPCDQPYISDRSFFFRINQRIPAYPFSVVLEALHSSNLDHLPQDFHRDRYDLYVLESASEPRQVMAATTGMYSCSAEECPPNGDYRRRILQSGYVTYLLRKAQNQPPELAETEMAVSARLAERVSALRAHPLFQGPLRTRRLQDLNSIYLVLSQRSTELERLWTWRGAVTSHLNAGQVPPTFVLPTWFTRPDVSLNIDWDPQIVALVTDSVVDSAGSIISQSRSPRAIASAAAFWWAARSIELTAGCRNPVHPVLREMVLKQYERQSCRRQFSNRAILALNHTLLEGEGDPALRLSNLFSQESPEWTVVFALGSRLERIDYTNIILNHLETKVRSSMPLSSSEMSLILTSFLETSFERAERKVLAWNGLQSARGEDLTRINALWDRLNRLIEQLGPLGSRNATANHAFYLRVRSLWNATYTYRNTPDWSTRFPDGTLFGQENLITSLERLTQQVRQQPQFRISLEELDWLFPRTYQATESAPRTAYPLCRAWNQLLELVRLRQPGTTFSVNPMPNESQWRIDSRFEAPPQHCMDLVWHWLADPTPEHRMDALSLRNQCSAGHTLSCLTLASNPQLPPTEQIEIWSRTLQLSLPTKQIHFAISYLQSIQHLWGDSSFWSAVIRGVHSHLSRQLASMPLPNAPSTDNFTKCISPEAWTEKARTGRTARALVIPQCPQDLRASAEAWASQLAVWRRLDSEEAESPSEKIFPYDADPYYEPNFITAAVNYAKWLSTVASPYLVAEPTRRAQRRPRPSGDGSSTTYQAEPMAILANRLDSFLPSDERAFNRARQAGAFWLEVGGRYHLSKRLFERSRTLWRDCESPTRAQLRACQANPPVIPPHAGY